MSRWSRARHCHRRRRARVLVACCRLMRSRRLPCVSWSCCRRPSLPRGTCRVGRRRCRHPRRRDRRRPKPCCPLRCRWRPSVSASRQMAEGRTARQCRWRRQAPRRRLLLPLRQQQRCCLRYRRQCRCPACVRGRTVRRHRRLLQRKALCPSERCRRSQVRVYCVCVCKWGGCVRTWLLIRPPSCGFGFSYLDKCVANPARVPHR